jgi:hypothetical protein
MPGLAVQWAHAGRPGWSLDGGTVIRLGGQSGSCADLVSPFPTKYPRHVDTPRLGIALSDGSRIVVSKEQLSCDLAGEAAIVNLKNGVYYGLDPVGARIWSLIREPMTFAELCASLAREYDVDGPMLESDIREFIGQLAEQGLVEISS